MSRWLSLSVSWLALTVLVSGSRAQAQEERNTQYVKIAHFEELRYPAIAASARVQGAVVLKVALDQEGRVASAAYASGPALLAQAALENVKKWRFYPSAQRDETIVFGFRLEPGCGRPHRPSVFQLIQPNFALISGCTPTVNE